MIAIAALARAVGPFDTWPGADPGQVSPVSYAFWFLIASIVQAVWKGIEIAGRVTLEVLKWSVLQLWTFAREVAHAAKAIGVGLSNAARRTWDFFQDTYTHVLKPAWSKLAQWYRRAREWLDKTIKPIYKFLFKLRSEFLKYYDRWVRPILDALDVAHRVLGVLRAFGWDWAVRLDDFLTRVQERIDLPFRLVLAKINEVINTVNRVVTLDGLLQRVALIRSIERDIRLVNRAFANWRSRPVTPEEYAERRRAAGRTEAEIWREFVATVEPGGAEQDPRASELAINWRLAIERR